MNHLIYVKKFLEKLKVITLAESLGGVESLCCVPYDMTHAAVPVENKLKMGITETLIRLSIGIEDFEDLRKICKMLGNVTNFCIFEIES